jgi:hypothetical protein
MREFRAYILDSAGHIASRIEMACADEEDAKARARQLADGASVELWEGARRIARFEPTPPQSRPFS